MGNEEQAVHLREQGERHLRRASGLPHGSYQAWRVAPEQALRVPPVLERAYEVDEAVGRMSYLEDWPVAIATVLLVPGMPWIVIFCARMVGCL